jgi:hypothetical protein
VIDRPAVRDKRGEHYPGLVVMDGRVSSSITLGQSRLPIWCIPHRGFNIEWHTGSPTAYGVSDDDLARFVFRLLEARGNWGRLLCIIADEERASEHVPFLYCVSPRAKKRLRAALQACIEELDAS